MKELINQLKNFIPHAVIVAFCIAFFIVAVIAIIYIILYKKYSAKFYDERSEKEKLQEEVHLTEEDLFASQCSIKELIIEKEEIEKELAEKINLIKTEKEELTVKLASAQSQLEVYKNAEKAKRSEAAKKGAETRRKNKLVDKKKKI